MREGVRAFNEWRIDNQDLHPDLSGANLSSTIRSSTIDPNLQDSRLTMMVGLIAIYRPRPVSLLDSAFLS